MKKDEIRIRPALEQDAKALLEIYAPYVQNTAITFEYQVPSLQEFEERIRHTKQKYPYLAAVAGEELLGYAYAGPFHERAAYDWAVETSIYVREDKKGMGIGRKLYEALEECLTAQGFLNLNACIAWPEREDEYLTRDSAEFHRRLGYRMVGEFHQCGYKFNRWYNMVWMEKHIGVHREDQPAVKPFEQVLEKMCAEAEATVQSGEKGGN